MDYLNRILLDLVSPETDLDRLIVSMPPRHGKSETISRWFPAWALLNWPEKRVMLASYEAEFAASWGRKVKDIFELHCAERGLRVTRGAAAQSWWEIEKYDPDRKEWVSTGGGMYTAGVRGGFTGKGGDIVIVDDPIKNAEESLSANIREKIMDWYMSTLYTRLEPGCVVLLVQTRWNEDDLTGKVIQQMLDGGPDKWRIVNLPAFAEENDELGRKPGEALWPERYNEERLAQIEVSLGPYWFSALYQQKPIPVGKGLFQAQWVGRWEETASSYRLFHPDGRESVWDKIQCIKFSTVDLATSIKKQADYTCISTWAMTPNNELLLLHVDMRQMEGPDHVAMLQEVWMNLRPSAFYIEQAGYQLTTIQTALRAGLPVYPLVPDGDKLARAISPAARMKAGYYFFPKGNLYPKEEKQLWGFPGSDHDDFVDTVSLSFLVSNASGYAGNLE